MISGGPLTDAQLLLPWRGTLIAADLRLESVDLLADSSSGVLLRSFAIALLIMAPVALWQGWRIRERRRAQRSASFQEANDLATVSADDGPTLEAVVAEINKLAATLAPGERAEIDIAPELSVGGRPADATVVEAVVRDAMSRSGMALLETTSDSETVRLVCVRR